MAPEMFSFCFWEGLYESSKRAHNFLSTRDIDLRISILPCDRQSGRYVAIEMERA